MQLKPDGEQRERKERGDKRKSRKQRSVYILLTPDPDITA